MLKRILWLTAGVAVGVIVVRKLSRGADAMSPAGIAQRLRDNAVTVGDEVRSFMADVTEGMHDKEAELHEAMAAGEPLNELLEPEHNDDR